MLDRYAALAPVLLRLALGPIFIAHGIPKLINTAGVAGFFANIGLPAPYAMTLLVGLVEVIGGTLVLIGYGTRLGAALLAVVMLVAITMVKWSQGFLNGWEFDFMLLAAALSLMLSGPYGRKA